MKTYLSNTYRQNKLFHKCIDTIAVGDYKLRSLKYFKIILVVREQRLSEMLSCDVYAPIFDPYLLHWT